jgi:UDP-glucose 4-epimerase
MVDVASALAEGHGVPVTITGIRPGEKLDEMLVSEEEAERTIARDGHYVIRPMLPELADEAADRAPRALTGAYGSGSAVMSLPQVRTLLAASGLLVS